MLEPLSESKITSAETKLITPIVPPEFKKVLWVGDPQLLMQRNGFNMTPNAQGSGRLGCQVTSVESCSECCW